MIKKVERVKSIDGSSKYLFNDGESENGNFEALYFYPVDNKQKSSICISTQVGCAVGCAFCATGKLGLKRNLKSSEMIEAIVQILEEENKDGENIDNLESIALMGMGEPLHNYNEVKIFYHQAMEILHNIKHISLSTSGITDNIIKLADDDTNYNLLFSLHSPFDEERSKLMPINKRYPLKSVINACEYYYYKKQKDALGMKIKASYLLLKDFNDSDRHIEQLVKILNSDVFKIQILLYNENENLPFKRPSLEKAKDFERKLNVYGLETKISVSKGQDIAGACGQMAGKKNIQKK